VYGSKARGKPWAMSSGSDEVSKVEAGSVPYGACSDETVIRLRLMVQIDCKIDGRKRCRPKWHGGFGMIMAMVILVVESDPMAMSPTHDGLMPPTPHQTRLDCALPPPHEWAWMDQNGCVKVQNQSRLRAK
jgi:hypothetical protein